MTDAVTPTTTDHLHLIEPEEGAMVDGLAVTFEWTDGPAASSCRLQVALDAEFSRLLLDTDVGAATSITVYDVFPPDGSSLFWRVTAVGESGLVPCPPRTFHVHAEHTAPAASPRETEPRAPKDPRIPHPVDPVDGAVTDGLATSFEWEPVADAASYRLQVASDPAFEHLQFDADLGRTQSITLYDLLPLDGPELSWRVEARNRRDLAVWSPAVRFRAVSNFAEFVRGKPSSGTTWPSPGAAGAVTAAPGSADIYAPRSTMGLVALWVAGSVALALLIILKVLLA